MKAIVSVSKGSNGTHVNLLGSGETEHDARISAAHFVNGGFCKKAEYDEIGYSGGECRKVSQNLATLLSLDPDKTWDNTYDQNGGLVESSANDKHFMQLKALSNLCINDRGELDTSIKF